MMFGRLPSIACLGRKFFIPLLTVFLDTCIFQQASRTALHKASISGQYETGKMLLDSGEEVDQRDQVLYLLHYVDQK